MRYSQLQTIFWFCYLIITILLSLLPPYQGLHILSIPRDKYQHFLAYFLLSSFFPWQQFRLKRITVFLFLTELGICLEILQNLLLINRTGDFYDAIANSLGVVAGIILISFINSTQQDTDSKEHNYTSINNKLFKNKLLKKAKHNYIQTNPGLHPELAILEAIILHGNFDDFKKLISKLGKEEVARRYWQLIRHPEHRLDYITMNFFNIYFIHHLPHLAPPKLKNNYSSIITLLPRQIPASIFSTQQTKILPLLRKFSRLFHLSNSTALSLYLQHRRPSTIHLYSHYPINKTAILKIINNHDQYNINIIQDQGQSKLLLDVNSVLINFVYFPFQIPATINLSNIINMPSLSSLAAIKSYLLIHDREWSNYVDLYFILQYCIDFDTLLKQSHALFQHHFSQKKFRQYLCYYDDIDLSKSIDYMQPQPDNINEIIQNFFIHLATH